MRNIVERCLNEIPLGALMFYGHNYGVNNLEWANDFTGFKDKVLIQSSHAVQRESEENQACTGVPFLQEIR